MTSAFTQQKTPLLSGDSVAIKRDEIKQYFANTWQTYNALFSLINADEAYFLRPEPLRHPLIFYFGHTATFFINKLILGKFISSRVNAKLEAICAVGVDEMSWDDLNSEHYDWPEVDEIRQYRTEVFTLVNTLIDEMPLTLPIKQNSLAWVILMGCEHERIHLETSSVIMRMLPLSFLTANQQWQSCPYRDQAPINELVAVQGKEVCLGKTSSDMTYGWDNEYGQLTQQVENFNTSKYLVSNQEFLAFVDAGGYRHPQYWTEEGQQWLAYKQTTMPRFWFRRNSEYFQRNLVDEIPLPLNWPVEVNYLEAKAFCNWQSQQRQKFIRLPTEAEWTLLRDKIPVDLVNWTEAPGNINLEYFASSCPVNNFEQQGLFDICGNVWQWTESAIDGFNGFNVHPLYDDFSTPTFDGKHNLIKGGSWISTGNEAIKSSRYAFRRHFTQHAGFRYVESEHQQLLTSAINPYETDAQLCQQLACHYPDNLEQVDSYPSQLASLIVKTTKHQQIKTGKVLNLGCSVGRTAFELSPYFQSIDAVDFSARYIQFGVKLQQKETIRYQSVLEGELVDFNEISINKHIKEHHNNVSFSQGDAVNLKPMFSGYDVIVLQQALEQSYDPKKILSTIHQRLNKYGLLVVASDYIFDEQITSKDKWLSGIKVNGENVTGFDGIAQRLSNDFTFLEKGNLMQSLKLNRYQTINKHIEVTVWQYHG